MCPDRQGNGAVSLSSVYPSQRLKGILSQMLWFWTMLHPGIKSGDTCCEKAHFYIEAWKIILFLNHLHTATSCTNILGFFLHFLINLQGDVLLWYVRWLVVISSAFLRWPGNRHLLCTFVFIGNLEGEIREKNPQRSEVVFGPGYILEYYMAVLAVRRAREPHIFRSGNINFNAMTRVWTVLPNSPFDLCIREDIDNNYCWRKGLKISQLITDCNFLPNALLGQIVVLKKEKPWRTAAEMCKYE